jgi:hypothetical protein
MVRFAPEDFSCQLCGLRLITPAKLAVAGVPREWDVPDIDVADFVKYRYQDNEFE